MNVRNCKVTFRLSKDEKAQLKRLAKVAGMKQEPFLRALIMGTEIKEHPPELWAELVRQLSAVGNNINQIARVANGTGHVRREDIEYIAEMQSKIWRKVKGL